MACVQPGRAVSGQPVIARPCSGADRRPARSGPRPRRREAQPNCRERKKTSTFCWNWIFVGAIPRARKSTTFAGIGFLLAQFRERESLQLSLELLVVLIARPCSGADRRPARSGPPSRRRLANGQTAASAKKRAKVVHLLLELDFCWRNFTSAKVVQLLLKLLFCYGAPGKIRTPDPQIRSLVLYPAELPVRMINQILFPHLARTRYKGKGLIACSPIAPARRIPPHSVPKARMQGQPGAQALYECTHKRRPG